MVRKRKSLVRQSTGSQNQYGSKISDGEYTYKSKFELAVSRSLRERNIRFAYEPDRIPYEVPIRRKNYLPDFALLGPHSRIYVELKGRFTRADRTKMLLVRTQHPEIDLRMVFSKKSSKKTLREYTAWCQKNNIQCAIGDIPDLWTRELEHEPVTK